MAVQNVRGPTMKHQIYKGVRILQYKNIYHGKVFRHRCYPGTPSLKKPTRKCLKTEMTENDRNSPHNYM